MTSVKDSIMSSSAKKPLTRESFMQTCAKMALNALQAPPVPATPAVPDKDEKPVVILKPIAESASIMRAMWGLTLFHYELKDIGYQYFQYSAKEKNERRRCGRCYNRIKKSGPGFESRGGGGTYRGGRVNRGGRNNRPFTADDMKLVLPDQPGHWINRRANPDAAYQLPNRELIVEEGETGENLKPGEGRCWSHIGHPVGFESWTCCGGSLFAEGCVGRGPHTGPQSNATWKLLDEQSKDEVFVYTPDLSHFARSDVLLKVETGPAREGGLPVLVRIVAVDFYTAEPLIDALVLSDRELLHTNPRLTGITGDMLIKACETGEIIVGREAARERIWKHVGMQTRLIMHNGQKDMIALRWIHRKTVDTNELENRYTGDGRDEEVEEPYFDGMKMRKPKVRKPTIHNLATLAQRRLGRRINQGKYDIFEHMMACRDLVLHYVQHMPPSLRREPEGHSSWKDHFVVEPRGWEEEKPARIYFDTDGLWEFDICLMEYEKLYDAVNFELGQPVGRSESLKVERDLKAPWWGLSSRWSSPVTW